MAYGNNYMGCGRPDSVAHGDGFGRRAGGRNAACYMWLQPGPNTISVIAAPRSFMDRRFGQIEVKLSRFFEEIPKGIFPILSGVTRGKIHRRGPREEKRKQCGGTRFLQKGARGRLAMHLRGHRAN